LTDSTEALEFGQKKLTPFGKVPKYVEKLEVTFPKPTYAYIRQFSGHANSVFLSGHQFRELAMMLKNFTTICYPYKRGKTKILVLKKLSVW
jgi:hypothetical protein